MQGPWQCLGKTLPFCIKLLPPSSPFSFLHLRLISFFPSSVSVAVLLFKNHDPSLLPFSQHLRALLRSNPVLAVNLSNDGPVLDDCNAAKLHWDGHL